jgi:hypothetical protein
MHSTVGILRLQAGEDVKCLGLGPLPSEIH